MLIDTTFFTGDLHIEGLSGSPGIPSATSYAISEELQNFIDKKERDFYAAAIGVDNAKEFVSYLVNAPLLPVEKWENLKRMLVEEIGGVNYSPIAYYIFFYYLRNNQTKVTPLGVRSSDEEGKSQPCREKMIYAWNEMVNLNEYLSRWLYKNRSDYGGYFFSDHLTETINKMGI